MATMTRTDIHRPSAVEFDPEAYEVLGFADFHETEGSRPVATVNAFLAQGYSFGGAPHGSGQCSHCGARLRYAALMGHEATKTLMYVGETCLENRFESTAAEFQAMRKMAAAKAEKSRREGKSSAFLAEHPEAAYLSYAHNISVAGGVVEYTDLTWDRTWETEAEALEYVNSAHSRHVWGNQNRVVETMKQGTTWAEQVRMGDKTSTLTDMWYRIEKYGEISDKALAYAMKIMGWMDEAEQRLQARQAEAAAQAAAGVEVPNGKQTVEGTVLSTKWVDNGFGSTLKMLVQHDSGWKVFGTVPNSIDVEKGDRVRFTATLEQSKDDSLFGFYKRPSKAQVL